MSEYVPVDIRKLRPKDSYGQLFRRRTHTIKDLVARFGRVPPELLASRACPTCGASDAVHELTKDHMDLVRCRACDLVYTAPIFDEAHYDAIYRSEDYQEIMRDLGEGSHAYRVERFGKERVAILDQHMSPTARRRRLLDVGCSTGFVIEAARAAGWEAIGIDLNPSAIEFGRSRGLDVRNASLDDEALVPESFDAVTLFDVIEHLPDPVGVLRSAIQLLRPGGVVFLYVPNYDSASRLLLGADAHFIWPTHHLNYYTPKTLRELMLRVGLNPEYVVTEGLDIVDYIWQQQSLHGRDTKALEEIADQLQFFVNAGAYGKNLRMLARKVGG